MYYVSLARVKMNKGLTLPVFTRAMQDLANTVTMKYSA